MTAKISPGSIYIVDRLLKNGTVFGTDDSRYLNWVDSLIGENTPDWKRRLKEGLSATSTCNGIRTEYPDSRGSITLDVANPSLGKTDKLEVFGSVYHALPSILPITDSGTQAKAVARYIANARSAVKSADGLQILGELRETISMLRHPLESAQHLVTGYAENLAYIRKKGSPKTRLKAAANLYLELQFGWKPLLMDIKSIISAAQELEKPIRTHINGGDTLDYTNVLVPGQVTNLRGIPVTVTVEEKSSVNYHYKGAMVGSCSGPVDANSRFGIRLDEFVPTAWELLPFSFLVDYFTNIGDILNSASYFDANIAWTNFTTRQEQIRSVSIYPNHVECKNAYGDNFISAGGLITFQAKTTTFGRTAPTTLMPSFTAHLPANGWQVANMTAVFIQLQKMTPF